jgi:hypothetical protein
MSQCINCDISKTIIRFKTTIINNNIIKKEKLYPKVGNISI